MRRDYRINAAVLEQDDTSLAGAVVEPIWMLPTGSVHATQLPRAWAAVTKGQVYVYAVTWVEREVINGGFWQYLRNTSADLPLKALEGCRQMGLGKYAELLTRAFSVFPGEALPASRKERMRFLPEDPYGEVTEQQKQNLDLLDELTD